VTTSEYRAAIEVQRSLVRRGFHPARAGRLVRQALDRLAPSGLGVHQTRSLRRDLDPSIKPRQIVSGEQ
jgi:hypothetical protein